MSSILSITAGAPFTGKTFFIETMVSNVARKTGKPAFVYNRGRPSDYKHFEKIDFLTVDETIIFLNNSKKRINGYENNPKILFFKYDGKIYHIDSFQSVLHGKCVAMNRFEDENLLFRAINHKLGGIQMVIDDSKTIFRNGLSKEAISLFDRLNHAGSQNRKNGAIGMDLHVMFHSLDAVNPNIYDYATHLFLTKSTNIPNLSKLNIPNLNESVKSAYIQLKNEKDYTVFQVNVFSKNSEFLIKIEPEKVEAIRKNLYL